MYKQFVFLIGGWISLIIGIITLFKNDDISILPISFLLFVLSIAEIDFKGSKRR